MTSREIILKRLANQHIVSPVAATPGQVVSGMVAMQAQDYPGAKWSVGMRMKQAHHLDIETAFNTGKILRTHVMRPTWHFVTPGDIRWLLALTAPRVHAANGFMYRQEGLDKKTINGATKVLEKALEGKNFLTRDELKMVLEKKKIIMSRFRLSYLVMHAELEGIVCSGPRKGNQFTYALLDELVPRIKPVKNDEALFNLAGRYFSTRGPATIKDFAWWSGLTVIDAKKGTGSLGHSYIRENINGAEYIFIPSEVENKSTSTFLMSDYDEYGISYKDRSALFPELTGRPAAVPSFTHMIIIDGKIAGTWKKIVKGKNIEIECAPFITLSGPAKKNLDHAVNRYREFFL